MKDFLNFQEDFLTYLRVECGFSKRTIEEYALDMRLFLQYLTNETSCTKIEDITLPILRRYLVYLEDKRNNGPAARGRRVSSLRSFFNYLVSEGHITDNPALKLNKPKRNKTIPVYLTEKECLNFLRVIEQNCTHATRNATIIKLLLSTGIRVSELVGLDVKDIDFDRCEIKVMGKGSKERVIPLNSAVTEQLIQYLKIRPDTEEKALFIARNNGYKRITADSVQSIFRNTQSLPG